MKIKDLQKELHKKNPKVKNKVRWDLKFQLSQLLFRAKLKFYQFK